MRAEDLKGWLAVARRGGKGEGDSNKRRGRGREKGERRTDEKAGEENSAQVVELLQTAFRDGDLVEEFTWQAVVFIP